MNTNEAVLGSTALLLACFIWGNRKHLKFWRDFEANVEREIDEAEEKVLSIWKRLHPVHYVMHAVTAALSIALGASVHVGVAKWADRHPQTVLWSDGQMQTNFIHSTQAIPLPTDKIVWGVMQNGHVVWKVVK